MATRIAPTDSYPSPATPEDTDTEPAVPSSMKSRKRSASEMEEEKPRMQSLKAHSASKTISKRAKKRKRSPAHVSETIEAESSPDFMVECPAAPANKRLKIVSDVLKQHLAPAIHTSNDMAIDFTVYPGSQWAKFVVYKNAKFKDPVELVYTAGQIVYVNKQSPIPSPPPLDATDDEKLIYDKKNLWVGQISEFRAPGPEKVFVLLHWLYWPEELPGGRQSYHGKKELVMSNHVDIVEATTIASHADVSYWDENDDSNATVMRERYWRQTYDLKKRLKDPSHALSKLRKFCICGGHDKPELEMFQCRKVGCGMWNHEACLLYDIEEKAWEDFKKGVLTHNVSEDHKSLVQKLTSTVGQIVDKALHKDGVKDTALSTVRSAQKPKAGSSAKRPWAGKLEAKITKEQTTLGEVTHHASVRQLTASYDSKRSKSFQTQTWNREMPCLQCGQSLN